MNLVKKATLISSLTAFLLAVFKLFIGFFTNSIAILSSAIDSLLDLGVSLFNFFAVSNATKHPDKTYNYGKGKLEALASFLEGIIITLSGVFIFYESVRKLILKEEVNETLIGIGVMIFSVFVTFFLVYFLRNIWKKTENLVIKADILHYKTDLLSNTIILIGLVFIYFFKIYFIDAILGIIIAIYIIFSAFEIIKKGFGLLLDISLSKDEIKQIKKIIESAKKVESYHKFKTRDSGHIKFVEAHLVFEEGISLFEAHEISHEIGDKIKKINKNFKRQTIFHMEPYNDEDEDD